MTQSLNMYEWLKVVHILAVISWMAGLLYLPRLFVYHADVGVGTDQDVTFKVMEGRLLKVIMRPASVVVLVSGLGLIHVVGLGELWLWLKLAAVVMMFGVHGKFESVVKNFAAGKRDFSSRYFRIVNEVPTVLMIVIVVMVVVKPFQ